MNTTQFLQHTTGVFVKCQDVLQKKNSDYSASDANPFRNFNAVEYFEITDAKRGILVRLSDKFMRVINLLSKGPSVKEESILDTIEDAINYLAILHAKIEDEKQIK